MKKAVKSTYSSVTIHALPMDERPHERLQRLGTEALSAQELLALILGRGISGESVMVTAQRLLGHFHNLKGVAGASLEELAGIRGIGIAKACQIQAAFEISSRANDLAEHGIRTAIKTPEDAFNLVARNLAGRKKEHFLALMLDTRGQLIKIAPISIGSLDSSIVHLREVFKEAVAASAASIIFAHNHPSGSTEASEDDIALTRRLSEAGQIMGIEVLDHIIVADGDFLSLKRGGLY
jgi:DNA repair protein RadC